MLIHRHFEHEVRGLGCAGVSFKGILVIRYGRQGDFLIPMISLLFRLDRNSSAFARGQRQSVSVEVEVGRYLVVAIHRDLHDQVGGFRRAGEALEGIAFVRHRRQRNLVIHMVVLLLRTDGHGTSGAGSYAQMVCVVKERHYVVVLVHGDLHDQVGGLRRSYESREGITVVRHSRQRHHFVQVIRLFLRAYLDRSALSGIDRQSISVEVEIRRDHMMLIHCDFHIRTRRRSRACEVREGIAFVRRSRYRHFFVQMILRLVGNQRHRSAIPCVHSQGIGVEVEVRRYIVVLIHRHLYR